MAFNLNIDDGYREFMINDDPNKIIRFNPTDMSIVDRFNEAREAILQLKIDTVADDYGTETAETDGNTETDSEIDKLTRMAQATSEADKKIRALTDYIFASPVSDVVFGHTHSLSTVKGVPYFERFLNAVQPFIEKAVKDEQTASGKRVNSYTKKYKGKSK